MIGLKTPEVTFRTWLAAGLLSLLPLGASAQVMTGNDILTFCTSNDSAQAGACAGWVIGVNEGFIAGASAPFYSLGMVNSAADANALSSQTLGYCLPTEVENRQLLDVAVQYLQSHPESRHMPARGLYLLAAQEAFPCPVP